MKASMAKFVKGSKGQQGEAPEAPEGTDQGGEQSPAPEGTAQGGEQPVDKFGLFCELADVLGESGARAAIEAKPDAESFADFKEEISAHVKGLNEQVQAAADSEPAPEGSASAPNPVVNVVKGGGSVPNTEGKQEEPQALTLADLEDEATAKAIFAKSDRLKADLGSVEAFLSAIAAGDVDLDGADADLKDIAR